MCECQCTYITACMWMSEDNLAYGLHFLTYLSQGLLLFTTAYTSLLVSCLCLLSHNRSVLITVKYHIQLYMHSEDLNSGPHTFYPAQALRHCPSPWYLVFKYIQTWTDENVSWINFSLSLPSFQTSKEPPLILCQMFFFLHSFLPKHILA